MKTWTENEIAHEIVDVAFHIHKALGPGLLETVYEVVLARELERRGLSVVRQQPVPIVFGDLKFDEGFRADSIVEGKVIVELKSARCLEPVHEAQLLNYLKATDFEVGLLLNFGHRPVFRRMLLDNTFKHSAPIAKQDGLKETADVDSK